MTARKKAPTAEKVTRRRNTGAKEYRASMLPKIRTLVGEGLDEFGVATVFAVDPDTFLDWVAASKPLQELFDSREEYRRWDHERNIRVAKELAARGASDSEIADTFEITARTLARWRRKFPDFDEALKMGAEMRLELAERTLFNLAVGYNYDEERIVSGKNGLRKVFEKKRAAPDPNMLKFYLATTKPDKYSAKPKPEAGDDAIGEMAAAVKEEIEENPEIGSVKINEKDEG